MEESGTDSSVSYSRGSITLMPMRMRQPHRSEEDDTASPSSAHLHTASIDFGNDAMSHVTTNRPSVDTSTPTHGSASHAHAQPPSQSHSHARSGSPLIALSPTSSDGSSKPRDSSYTQHLRESLQELEERHVLLRQAHDKCLEELRTLRVRATTWESQRRAEIRRYRCIILHLMTDQYVKNWKMKQSLFHMQELVFSLLPALLKEFESTPSHSTTFDSDSGVGTIEDAPQTPNRNKRESVERSSKRASSKEKMTYPWNASTPNYLRSRPVTASAIRGDHRAASSFFTERNSLSQGHARVASALDDAYTASSLGTLESMRPAPPSSGDSSRQHYQSKPTSTTTATPTRSKRNTWNHSEDEDDEEESEQGPRRAQVTPTSSHHDTPPSNWAGHSSSNFTSPKRAHGATLQPHGLVFISGLSPSPSNVTFVPSSSSSDTSSWPTSPSSSSETRSAVRDRAIAAALSEHARRRRRHSDSRSTVPLDVSTEELRRILRGRKVARMPRLLNTPLLPFASHMEEIVAKLIGAVSQVLERIEPLRKAAESLTQRNVELVEQRLQERSEHDEALDDYAHVRVKYTQLQQDHAKVVKELAQVKADYATALKHVTSTRLGRETRIASMGSIHVSKTELAPGVAKLYERSLAGGEQSGGDSKASSAAMMRVQHAMDKAHRFVQEQRERERRKDERRQRRKSGTSPGSSTDTSTRRMSGEVSTQSTATDEESKQQPSASPTQWSSASGVLDPDDDDAFEILNTKTSDSDRVAVALRSSFDEAGKGNDGDDRQQSGGDGVDQVKTFLTEPDVNVDPSDSSSARVSRQDTEMHDDDDYTDLVEPRDTDANVDRVMQRRVEQQQQQQVQQSLPLNSRPQSAHATSPLSVSRSRAASATSNSASARSPVPRSSSRASNRASLSQSVYASTPPSQHRRTARHDHQLALSLSMRDLPLSSMTHAHHPHPTSTPQTAARKKDHGQHHHQSHRHGRGRSKYASKHRSRTPSISPARSRSRSRSRSREVDRPNSAAAALMSGGRDLWGLSAIQQQQQQQQAQSSGIFCSAPRLHPVTRPPTYDERVAQSPLNFAPPELVYMARTGMFMGSGTSTPSSTVRSRSRRSSTTGSTVHTTRMSKAATAKSPSGSGPAASKLL